jgi:hypothetical protein
MPTAVVTGTAEDKRVGLPVAVWLKMLMPLFQHQVIIKAREIFIETANAIRSRRRVFLLSYLVVRASASKSEAIAEEN